MQKINLEKCEDLADVFCAVMGGRPESIREIEAFMKDSPLQKLIHSSDVERIIEYDGFFADEVIDAVYALLPVKLQISPKCSWIMLPQTFRKLNAVNAHRPASRCINVAMSQAYAVYNVQFEHKVQEVVKAVQELKKERENEPLEKKLEKKPDFEVKRPSKPQEEVRFAPKVVIAERKANNPNFGVGVMRDSVDDNRSSWDKRVRFNGLAERQKAKESRAIAPSSRERLKIDKPEEPNVRPKENIAIAPRVQSAPKPEIKKVEKVVAVKPEIQVKKPAPKPIPISQVEKIEPAPKKRGRPSSKKVEEKQPVQKAEKPVKEKKSRRKQVILKPKVAPVLSPTPEITVEKKKRVTKSKSKKNRFKVPSPTEQKPSDRPKVSLEVVLAQLQMIKHKLGRKNLSSTRRQELKKEANRLQTAKYRLEHPDAWRKNYKKMSELSPEEQEKRRIGNRRRNETYRQKYSEELKIYHNARRAKIKEVDPELLREQDKKHNSSTNAKAAKKRYYATHTEEVIERARVNLKSKVYKQRSGKKKRFREKTGPVILSLLQGIINSKQ